NLIARVILAVLGKLDAKPLVRAFVHTAKETLHQIPREQGEPAILGQGGRIELEGRRRHGRHFSPGSCAPPWPPEDLLAPSGMGPAAKQGHTSHTSPLLGRLKICSRLRARDRRPSKGTPRSHGQHTPRSRIMRVSLWRLPVPAATAALR